jgi:hypothetical protein
MNDEGMERINFEAYTVQQLVEIVNARLEVARTGQVNQAQVMKPDAINFAARKVASIFGDARRVLDVCRYAQGAYTRLSPDPRVNIGALSRCATPPKALGWSQFRM